MRFNKKLLTLSAQFSNSSTAEYAKNAICLLLNNAEKEVNALFNIQDGRADSCQILAIYARYGFKNDCGWIQSFPIRIENGLLFWDLPEGMLPENAEHCLQLFGAISIRRGCFDDDSLTEFVPHPSVLFPSELSDFLDIDEDDSVCFVESHKKTFH